MKCCAADPGSTWRHGLRLCDAPLRAASRPGHETYHSAAIRDLVGAQSAPPAANAVLALDEAPEAAASKDALRPAVGVDRAAKLALGRHPFRIDEGRVEQAAHARRAIGIGRADLVGRDPAASGIGLWRAARIFLVVLVVLARRLGAFDQKTAVLEADDAEFSEPAAIGRVLAAAELEPVRRRKRAEHTRLDRWLGAHVEAVRILVDGPCAEITGLGAVGKR